MTSHPAGDVAALPTSSDKLSEYVTPPGGRKRRSRVRRVDAGQVYAFATEAPGPDDPGALPSNWITYAVWQNATGGPITRFETQWRVPQAPAIKGQQLLYLFNGLQSMSGVPTIVQPVLQWGNNGGDQDGGGQTGQYWTAATWMVTGSYARCSEHVIVNPGDVLTGVITAERQANGTFIYTSEFVEQPATRRVWQPVQELVACVLTLEAYELPDSDPPRQRPYDLNDVSKYPSAPVVFGAIAVVTDPPTAGGAWTPVNVGNVGARWGEATTPMRNSTTNGQVRIQFNANVVG